MPYPAKFHGTVVCSTTMALILSGMVFFNFLVPSSIFAAEPAPVKDRQGKDPSGQQKDGVLPVAQNAENKKNKRRKAKKARFYPIIMEAAQRHDVEPALIMAIIHVESRYNPEAVSQKGATGLMQLMPRTAKYLGVTDCLDPRQNVEAGVRYFKEMQARFDGDIKLALAAYNAGRGNVIRYGGVPPFAATQKYIDEVLSAYETYMDQISDMAAAAIELEGNLLKFGR